MRVVGYIAAGIGFAVLCILLLLLVASFWTAATPRIVVDPVTIRSPFEKVATPSTSLPVPVTPSAATAVLAVCTFAPGVDATGRDVAVGTAIGFPFVQQDATTVYYDVDGGPAPTTGRLWEYNTGASRACVESQLQYFPGKTVKEVK